MTAWTAEVTMLSDWHVGNGSGRPGDVDRLVRRDADGLPFLPAKTLTGMWRDACERAASALDDSQTPGRWAAWVETVFGTQGGHPGQSGGGWREAGPRPASLSIRPARYGEALGAMLRARPGLRDAATIIRPGVRIDPASGRAMEKHLRMVEHARAGCTLVATVTLADESWSPDQREAAEALLVMGAALLDRVGAKRRRGSGRCRVQVAGATSLAGCIAWARQHQQPAEPPGWARVGQPRPTPMPPAPPVGDGWVETDLLLTLRTPLCTPLVTTGNVIATRDRIPGGLLLPAILALIGLDEAHAAARAGNLLVTDATVEVSGSGTWPLPRSLVHPKGAPDLASGGTVDNLLASWPERPKPHRRGYVVPPERPGLPAIFTTAQLALQTHNVIADEVQRPTTEVGGVFSVQSINAGTTFRFQVRFRGSVAVALVASWPPAPATPLTLGRSKKDDYGLAEISVLPSRRRPRRVNPPGTLTVWALSDILLRDERLRPTAGPEALARAVETELGVSVRWSEDGSEKCGATTWAGAADRTESWHRAWGLPRASIVGMAAGSVVTLSVEGPVDPSILDRLEASGIGERRAEGYGQVRFNDLLLAEPSVTGEPATLESPAEPSPVATSDRDHSVARAIERGAWRAEIARSAALAAHDAEARKRYLGLDVASPPKAAQLGALRTVIGRLRSREDRPTVTGWMSAIEHIDTRRDQWPDAVRRRLIRLVTDDAVVWAVLEFDGRLAKALCLTAGAEDALRQELWAEAVRALVVATVRAHAHTLRSKGGD